MEVALYWLASTPEWELKEVLGPHARLDAEQVERLRGRIGEMRSPAPRMDVTPDAAIDQFFDELLSAKDSFEKIVGLFGLLRPALLAAFEQHDLETNPLIDHPTHYLMQHLILDQRGWPTTPSRPSLPPCKVPSSSGRRRGKITCKRM